MNDDFDFVVFKVKSVDLKYQPILVVGICFALLMYMMWCRQRILQSLSRAIEISKYKLRHEEPPVELQLGSAPPWLWPLPRSYGRNVQAADIAEYLGVGRRPIQASLGPALMVALLLMAGHTIWAHHRLADKIVGKDFDDNSVRELVEFEQELPHSMAFTGWSWFDLALLIAGFAAAYMIMDRILWQRHGDSRDVSQKGPPPSPDWAGMTRRGKSMQKLHLAVYTALVAALVVGPEAMADPVIGTSQTSPGVFGESQEAEGVRGVGHKGAGVSGTSEQWLGVFGATKAPEAAGGEFQNSGGGDLLVRGRLRPSAS